MQCLNRILFSQDHTTLLNAGNVRKTLFASKITGKLYPGTHLQCSSMSAFHFAADWNVL